jgi:SAM-dependent methyltransferase
MSYRYDSEFFDFVNASAGKSARRFIDVLEQSVLAKGCVADVIDVGCGRGVWVAEWRRRGARRVLGVDGDYIPLETLLMPRECFLATDLSKRFAVDLRFDLVQCLEVAEHIAPQAVGTLVDSLIDHGDVIVFSAAVPGQGGEHHVNEQNYQYWRRMFAARGFQMYDAIRPLLRGQADVEPWYRYNAFVYANKAGIERLTPQAQKSLLAAPKAIPNFAPLTWRVRCGAVSLLPRRVANLAARMKHRVANRLATDW